VKKAIALAHKQIPDLRDTLLDSKMNLCRAIIKMADADPKLTSATATAELEVYAEEQRRRARGALKPTEADGPSCDSVERVAEGYRNGRDMPIVPLAPLAPKNLKRRR